MTEIKRIGVLEAIAGGDVPRYSRCDKAKL